MGKAGLALVFLGFLAAGCTPPPVPRDVVLQPCERIEFRNRFGRGATAYHDLYEREYRIDGKTYIIPMIAREKPFRGKLGLYNPAAGSAFSNDPYPRIVAEESILHFDSLEEAQRHLVEGSAVMDWVYNDQGYVVGFSRAPERGNQMNVSLFRYYIAGKPALNMPGYDNEAVRVVHAAPPPAQ